MSESVPSAPQGMVFGTPVSLQSAVSILEMPFPSARTLHWVPKNMRLSEANLEGGPEDVDLVITQDVLLATSRHVSQTLERELGGFLLGNRYRCPTGRMYVLVDQFVEGEETESDHVSLHFTHESWRRLEDQLAMTYLGKVLVGWYHSHPRMNVFLSRDDLSIHERRFGEPWKSALVLEPQKHFGGFFCWRGGQLNTQVPVDFYEMLRDDTRKTVVAWENYTGVDPLKNVTPPLAETNTKSVQPATPFDKGRLIPVPRRPWVRPALVAAAFMTVALFAWQLTRRPTGDAGGGAGQANQGAAVVASPTAAAPTAVAEETQAEQPVEATTSGNERQPGGGSSAANRGKTSGDADKAVGKRQEQAASAAAGGGKNGSGAKTNGNKGKTPPGRRKPGGTSTAVVGPHGKG